MEKEFPSCAVVEHKKQFIPGLEGHVEPNDERVLHVPQHVPLGLRVLHLLPGDARARVRFSYSSRSTTALPHLKHTHTNPDNSHSDTLQNKTTHRHPPNTQKTPHQHPQHTTAPIFKQPTDCST